MFTNVFYSYLSCSSFASVLLPQCFAVWICDWYIESAISEFNRLSLQFPISLSHSTTNNSLSTLFPLFFPCVQQLSNHNLQFLLPFFIIFKFLIYHQKRNSISFLQFAVTMKTIANFNFLLRTDHQYQSIVVVACKSSFNYNRM